jgi:hypothetical protein
MSLMLVACAITGRVLRREDHCAEQREHDEQHDIAEEQDLRKDRGRCVHVDDAEHAARNRKQKKHETPFQHSVLAGPHALQ